MPISNQVDINSLLGIPTLGAQRFNISAVGLGSAILGLAGNTSGVATITAPAVAGTSTNAFTLSNVLLGPLGAVGTPTYGGGTSNNSGIYFIGTTPIFSHFGSSAFLIQSAGVRVPADSVYGLTQTNNDATATLDTGMSRLGAASIAFGNGTASDTTANLSFNKTIKYAGVATVSQGQPAEYATVDLTAQSAAIGATTLYAVPATGAGMYRISWSATITTVDGAASVLGGTNGFQVVYTSPTDSVVKTTVPGNSVTSAANTTGTAVGGCEVVYAKASTNIQYKYDYTSTTPGQMIYELHIKCEAL